MEHLRTPPRYQAPRTPPHSKRRDENPSFKRSGITKHSTRNPERAFSVSRALQEILGTRIAEPFADAETPSLAHLHERRLDDQTSTDTASSRATHNPMMSQEQTMTPVPTMHSQTRHRSNLTIRVPGRKPKPRVQVDTQWQDDVRVPSHQDSAAHPFGGLLPTATCFQRSARDAAEAHAGSSRVGVYLPRPVNVSTSSGTHTESLPCYHASFSALHGRPDLVARTPLVQTVRRRTGAVSLLVTAEEPWGALQGPRWLDSVSGGWGAREGWCRMVG